MKLPEKITTKILCAGNVDVSGIIICLRVVSGNKNPYFLLFPKTDASGFSSLTKEDFVGQFKDHWEMGLMDYSGTIESANPVVEASVFDVAWLLNNQNIALAWSLLKHERTKWRTRNEEYEYKISCRNPLFSSEPVLVNLEEQSSIQINVDLKK